MRLKVTPSSLKRWFQYRCERKFVYETMDPDERLAIPIDETEVLSAADDFGLDFERKVVRQYAGFADVRLLKPNPGERMLDERASIAFLSGRTGHTAAHQLVLSDTAALRERLGLPGPDDLQVSRGIVDLVVARDADGKRLLRLVDVKATDVPLPFHKVQVAWYAWMLRATIQSTKLEVEIDDVAAIWYRAPRPRSDGRLWEEAEFRLRHYESLAKDWCAHELRRAATRRVERSHDDTFFHLYFKCEQCQFLKHCERSISKPSAADWDVSAVPGISHQSKVSLARMGVRTVGDLAASAGRVLGQEALDWRLQTQGHAIGERANALLHGRVRRTERPTLRMPPRCDVKVFLVADHNSATSTLATLGTLIVESGRDPQSVIEVVRHRDEEPAALEKVLGTMLSALVEADSDTRGGNDRVLHIFVYEPAEARDVAAALGRHIENTALLRGLVHLLRIFPPEQMVPEPEYRGYHHLPASALRGVLEELIALPVKVSYDLARVGAAFDGQGQGPAAPYRPGPPFARPFSSRLALDVCQELVKGKADEGRIRQDVSERLLAMSGLVEWLERTNADLPESDRFLRLRKAPFRLHTTVDPLHVRDLDILMAQALITNRSQLMRTLTELARPVDARCERNTCISKLRLIKDGQGKWGSHWFLFEAPPEAARAELSPSDPQLLLTDGHPDRLLDPARWPDFAVRMKAPREGSPRDQLFLVMEEEAYESDGFQALLTAHRTKRWVLDRGFDDRTTGRLESFLRHVAGGQR
jgi:hypothetical protein